MTIEITDRAAFKDKFAALMAADVSLITAGIEPSRELSSQMIDEFLNQFTATTLAPAIPNSAGFVIVNGQTGYIPFDFRGKTYETIPDARLVITKFLSTKDYGNVNDYRVVEATYFG